MDKCREAFELWVKQNTKYYNGMLYTDKHDNYLVLPIHVAWKVWQEQQKLIEGRDFTIAAMQRSLFLANAKVDELQAKLDACQKLLEKWKTTGLKGSSDYAVGGAHTRQECEDELEQALKGGEV